MAVVQAEGKDGGAGWTSVVFTVSSTAAGSGLVIAAWLNTGNISSITDSATGTWTSRQSTGAIHIWDRIGAAAGVTSVTVNFSASNVGMCYFVEDDALDVFDKTAYTEVGTSTAPSSGNTATTTYADEIAYGVFGTFTDDIIDYTAGTDFSDLTGTGITAGQHNNVTAGNGSYVERRTMSSTGAYAATATCDSSYQYAAIVTYKLLSSAAPRIVVPTVAVSMR